MRCYVVGWLAALAIIGGFRLFCVLSRDLFYIGGKVPPAAIIRAPFDAGSPNSIFGEDALEIYDE